VTGSDLVAAAVISGNRNFEGRVHPLVKANFLASPPLVVAYALAGTVDIDLNNEPLGIGADGTAVYLKDLWPSQQEINEAVAVSVKPAMFTDKYADVFSGSDMWKEIKVSGGDLYEWDEKSTYIHHPPYFQELSLNVDAVKDIKSARVLGMFGVDPSEVDLFVSHQANRRIIQAAADRLGLPECKVVINLERFGNTTAATIPRALADAVADKRIKKGSLVLLTSVGAGFTVGAVLLRWGL
jgi:3-hydroxy-3-methylglutaryl CoA synthase